MTRELPQFVHDWLAAPPRAGEGVHAWLYRVARQLHAHLPAVEIVVLLESRVQGCGRHVSRQEIQDAVKNSLSCAWQPRFTGAPIQSTSKWPTVNQEQRAAIIRDGGGLVELWEAILPNEMWAGAEKFRQWVGSAGNFTFGHKGGGGQHGAATVASGRDRGGGLPDGEADRVLRLAPDASGGEGRAAAGTVVPEGLRGGGRRGGDPAGRGRDHLALGHRLRAEPEGPGTGILPRRSRAEHRRGAAGAGSGRLGADERAAVRAGAGNGGECDAGAVGFFPGDVPAVCRHGGRDGRLDGGGRDAGLRGGAGVFRALRLPAGAVSAGPDGERQDAGGELADRFAGLPGQRERSGPGLAAHDGGGHVFATGKLFLVVPVDGRAPFLSDH